MMTLPTEMEGLVGVVHLLETKTTEWIQTRYHLYRQRLRRKKKTTEGTT